uniref:Solute carrier family 22 member 18 n=1 Tax=Tetraselmis sp. GSL018 TaxID=582737 RepID=A0A061QUN5_9CHLO|mmetsp:Transcript_29809/g.71075  ORF Transcript_29809/g.71075 Transcript_29809/m.71075 type:complete len:436 (+) Transcript_29809:542-1849(+)|eukprot:CAMPEP_0177608332 /NCGR_PEP_ID=MMETSP0419_2-20121207/18415_1 /TAXON_ID=582737 /ORGANISM="Tetraselmis sp., Strain GSL018" /LENGTH=435 /DNA_ID=CAMNT_0019103015 /DNA_START=484 /DNA_END=1791 /DNA_ORIENTATION=+
MTTPRKSVNTALFAVYVNVVLYALCFQLQRPIEPFLVERLVKGDHAQAYSRVQAWFSVVQTAGSFVVGFLLDRFGLRDAFVINFLAAAVSYAVLANATTIELLYISKIPTLCMHGFLCAQATVSKCTEGGKNTVAALGRLTACYTVGATLGPALGGYLGANVDHYFGAKLAVFGSLLSAAIAFVFVPPDLRPESGLAGSNPSEGSKAEAEAGKMSFLHRTRHILGSTYDLMMIKIGTGLANSMMGSTMPLVLKNSFDFREHELGLAQSAMTFLSSLCNAFFLGPLAAALGSLVAVIRLCLLGTIAAFSAQAALLSVGALTANAFILLRLVLHLFQFILSSNLTGESTGRVPAELKGTLLGMEHGLFSAVRVFSPTAAVSLLGSHGLMGLTAAGAGIYAAVAAAWSLLSAHGKAAAAGREADAPETAAAAKASKAE